MTEMFTQTITLKWGLGCLYLCVVPLGGNTGGRKILIRQVVPGNQLLPNTTLVFVSLVWQRSSAKSTGRILLLSNQIRLLPPLVSDPACYLPAPTLTPTFSVILLTHWFLPAAVMIVLGCYLVGVRDTWEIGKAHFLVLLKRHYQKTLEVISELRETRFESK